MENLPQQNPQPSVESLIKQLSRDRDYGDRTYREMIDAIYHGEIIIQQGRNLPVLMDAETKMRVRGSGVSPSHGAKELSAAARDAFKTKFAEDEHEWYLALRKLGIEKLDPRAMKIAFEFGLDRPTEGRDHGLSGVMNRLFELAEKGMKPEREETVIEVTKSE